MSLKALRVELLISIALLPVLGCSANSADKVHAASSSTAENSSKTTVDSSFVFTEDDVAAYEKGLTREIALVKAARERGSNAKTTQARAAAAQDEWETATIPGGAETAGLSIERYQKVRKAVNHVLETLDLQGKIDGPMEIDLEHASVEMKQRLSKDAFAALSPASAAALRSRMASLVPVWVRYMKLIAVNG